jgi:hypothetical protein
MEARFYSKFVASWYFSTIDPYAQHASNVASRLRHPLHVVTRRILYGDVKVGDSVEDELEGLFNDDDAEIKEGPEALTRRSAARMEAFLASCSAALREEDHPIMKGGSGKTIECVAVAAEGGGKGMDAGGLGDGKKEKRTSSSSKPRSFRQIDLGDLLLRLEVYCRT